jgi:hypothetical protein
MQSNMTVRIRSRESLLQSKDEEYAYWQSRPPLERLVAMQELSFAFFEERDNEAEIRKQFFAISCLPSVVLATWIKA